MDDCTRSRKGWLWESLPPLPFGGIINSHTPIDDGRTNCVSSISDADGWGTYCFDTVEREWWEAGDWVLPFEGGAKYTSLTSISGLASPSASTVTCV